MLLPEHKFLVEQVGSVERTKDMKHEFRMIVFRKPGYTDEFGEKKGEDDLFEAKVWNKQLAELPALKTGDKVAVMLNLQGREYLDQNSSKMVHSLQLTIRKLKLL